MAKGTNINEISILKFFETGPIDKAETLYHIVAEKMRERLGTRAQDGGESGERRSTVRRQARQNSDAQENPSSSPTV